MADNHKSDIKRLLLVILAGVLMAVNIKTFVRVGGLIPGGVSGLSVLVQRLFLRFLNIDVPYTAVNVILNSVPVYIGFRFIGKKFTLYSLVMIVVSSVLTDLIPTIEITYDTLLTAVFGALINGLSISLCLYADATSGGTDFVAIYLSQKRGMESWNIILGFNAVLLCTAGLFFGWDKSLYSIIYQYITTQVLHMLYRDYQQQTLFIVTEKTQEICDAIHAVSHHGATIINAEGSHSHKQSKMVYSVVSGSDSKKVIKTIKDIDPNAFINSIRTSELRGNFYMRKKD